MPCCRSINWLLNWLLLKFKDSDLRPRLFLPWLLCPLLTSWNSFVFIAKSIVLLGQISRSLGIKFFTFVGFCLIYCLRLRLNFGIYAIHCSLPLRCSALYQISVRQNANFADGFLQISPHGEHPCHSLTLPINSVCAGTCTLPVKKLCPTY